METNRGTTVIAPQQLTLPQGAETARNIPSLDGLRAISILFVILTHSGWYLPAQIQDSLVFKSLVGYGIGVAVFFVISGYLITTLLLREFDKTGTVSLKTFYFRRSMRIFPPFYFLLAVMATLWVMHVIPEHLPSFLAAASYTWCYYPDAHGYFIQHTWSLSIEEQFYLLWPLMVAILRRREQLATASLLIILMMPGIRILFYFVLPSLRGHEYYMAHGWIDTMMVGCLLALLKHKGSWKRWERRYVNGWTASAMALLALFSNPHLYPAIPRKFAGFFSLAFSPTITACCIGGVLVYVIGNRDSVAGRILNNRVVRHVGVLSYSLYLWQQIFMSHKLSLLPYGYLYMFAMAELSFWLIEKPSLRLRSRLEARCFLQSREGQGA